ncbi:MAG: ammonium transporter [Cellvibrionaceae bacterium]|nr:ammonium transporter [Cellvibrionaceae bacterium]
MIIGVIAQPGWAAETGTDPMPSKEAIDVLWLAMASALVFFMQAGFALLESGMSRAKNCVNVVMKNFSDVCVGSLFFWLLGFGLMFGNNPSGWYGTSGFMLDNASTWDYSFLLFQTMFAATAATIASGAMAERARYSSYLVGAVVICAVIYPVFGSWAWGSFYEGEGWLAALGFIDFAGSSVVHSVGGWVALAAIIVLGPRLGRFDPVTKKARPLPGHNLNFVVLGGFILWFGWFGFNGGSTLAAQENIGLINLNTQLAASAGALGSMLLMVALRKDISVGGIVNGALSGLVGITAGCATMEPVFAIVTGALCAMFAFMVGVILLSNGLDDVVGAVSVHGAAGAAGTICAGCFVNGDLFNMATITVQLLGVFACFVWSFGSGLVLFKLIDLVLGLRAGTLHEQRGLDYTEHDEIAYPEFVQHSFYTRDNLSNLDK